MWMQIDWTKLQIYCSEISIKLQSTSIWPCTIEYMCSWLMVESPTWNLNCDSKFVAFFHPSDESHIDPVRFWFGLTHHSSQIEMFSSTKIWLPFRRNFNWNAWRFTMFLYQMWLLNKSFHFILSLFCLFCICQSEIVSSTLIDNEQAAYCRASNFREGI